VRKITFCFWALVLAATMLVLTAAPGPALSPKPRPRRLGLNFGDIPTGRLNAITDVSGVKVGHVTLVEGDSIRTGVTAIVPHAGNLYQEKMPAAIHVGNGYGKLAGLSQVRELGQLETPVLLTNTLSVGAVMEGVVRYTLSLSGNQRVRSVNAVVGECNDGYLNDIRGLHVRPRHAVEAIERARPGAVAEGCVGAGTGTVCHRFKGGIGTSSRTPGEFTLGVLVQTNFGRSLVLQGVPVGRLLQRYSLSEAANPTAAGSCMVVIATDAPLDARSLERLAARAMLGIGRTGGISSSTSGDYIIAFSTAPGLRIKHGQTTQNSAPELSHKQMNTLFAAVIDATEEAIVNSLFAAETTRGRAGHRVPALPVDKALQVMRQYRHLP